MKTSTLYKMKDWALQQIRGGHDESYALLLAYCEMVKTSNPGSQVFALGGFRNCEKTTTVHKHSISFTSQFMGCIQGCRGLIGVDGTNLKGNYGGMC